MDTHEVSLTIVYIFVSPLMIFFIYLLLYVDEILIISKKKVKIDKLKAQLRNEFVKNLAEAKKILGMEIQRDGKKKARFV